MKKTFVVLLATTVAMLGFASAGLAFHDGGVAECEGCHTMHNSLGGEVMQPAGSSFQTQFQAPAFLLQGSDQSSACLNCHESTDPGSYHISTAESVLGDAPINYTPGGDFAWLKKEYIWAAWSEAHESLGERHGHNIIAADFGYGADTTHTTAPGGTYPAVEAGSAGFYCTSCHDPHGKYRYLDGDVVSDGAVGSTSNPIIGSGSYYGLDSRGNPASKVPTVDEAVGTYRLLPGVGYEPKSTPGFAFDAAPPIALAPATYNKSETGTDTDKVRVQYGMGMSEYCSNCHGDLHMDATESWASGTDNLRHPAGNTATLKTSDINVNYNAYIKTGDLNGDITTSYDPLVPFERQLGRTALLTFSNTAANIDDGPDATDDNVMCLSCHRAHASGFSSMTRWNTEVGLIVEDGAYTIDYGAASGTADARTLAAVEAAYYERPVSEFSTFQRDLCNKCHVKD